MKDNVRSVLYENEIYINDTDLAEWIDCGVSLRMQWLETLDELEDTPDIEELRARLIGAIEVSTVIAARLRKRPQKVGPTVVMW